jgi:hypothetical protein
MLLGIACKRDMTRMTFPSTAAAGWLNAIEAMAADV